MTEEHYSARGAGVFTQDEIHALYQALIDAGVDPKALLAELEPTVLANLESVSTTPADSLLIVLSRLNRFKHIDGTYPIRTVLKTASLLAGPTAAQLVLQNALAALEQQCSSQSSALNVADVAEDSRLDVQPATDAVDALPLEPGGIDQTRRIGRVHVKVRLVASFGLAGALAGVTLQLTSGVTLALSIGLLLLFAIVLAYGLKGIWAAIKGLAASTIGNTSTGKLVGATAAKIAAGSAAAPSTALNWALSTAFAFGLCVATNEGTAAISKEKPSWRTTVLPSPSPSSVLSAPPCPSGRQLYNGSCISDKMVDFLVCMRQSNAAVALQATESYIKTHPGATEAEAKEGISQSLKNLPQSEYQLVIEFCEQAARDAP